MNILFVNNFRGRGGGEEFLRDLLPGLVSKGCTVGLICRPGTPLVDMFRDSGITVYPIQRDGLSGLSAVTKTARIIKQGSYAIIDIQRGHDIIQAWLGALLSGVKPSLMYTPQVPEFMRSRFLLSRMNRIVTISRHIRDKIISFDPKQSDKISILYYGIDLTKFSPISIKRGVLRKRFGLFPDTPIIGTVGDLWKNQIEFLNALSLIKKEIHPVKFALVASETGIGQIAAFKKRAEDFGLTDSIIWTGRLSKDEMLSFYADITLAVSTHRNEGFGIWILEALAVGTPVVSVNEGGIRDSLEGCPAGVLVDGGPAEMAAAIIRILNDLGLHRTMSEAGPHWTKERFSRERMVNDYYTFFQNLSSRNHTDV